MSIEELKKELKKKLKSYTFHFSIFCKVQAEAEMLEKEKTGTLNAGKSVNDNDGMPRGTRTSDATFDKVVRMIEYDERIKELQKEAKRHEEQMRNIEKLVAKIKDERQRHFVWTFYCRDEKLPANGKCDAATGLSKRQILYILDKALEELSKIC